MKAIRWGIAVEVLPRLRTDHHKSLLEFEQDG